MGKVVRSILYLAYVPVYKFVTTDPKVKRKKQPVVLEEQEGKAAVALRKSAWKHIEGAAATDVISDHELGLLSKDEELQRQLRGKKSLAKVLGINLDTYSGLMCEEKGFAPQHYSTVDHYIKGAQAACKLGRVISLESCMAPLSVGGDRDELPPVARLETGRRGGFRCSICRRLSERRGMVWPRGLLSRGLRSPTNCINGMRMRHCTR